MSGSRILRRGILSLWSQLVANFSLMNVSVWVSFIALTQLTEYQACYLDCRNLLQIFQKSSTQLPVNYGKEGLRL